MLLLRNIAIDQDISKDLKPDAVQPPRVINALVPLEECLIPESSIAFPYIL